MCIRFIVSSAVVALAGCSNYYTTKKATPSDGTGLTYYLSQGVLDLEVTRVIKDCTPVDMTVSSTASLITTYTADPSEAYVVDYQPMQEGTKGTELTIDLYPSGMLKKINGDSDDRSAEIAQNIISGVSKIAVSSLTGIQTGLAVAEAAPTNGEKPSLCSANIDGAVERLKTAKDKLAAGGQKAATARQVLKGCADGDKDCIGPAKAALADAEKKIAEANKEIAENTATLTFVTKSRIRLPSMDNQAAKTSMAYAPTERQQAKIMNTTFAGKTPEALNVHFCISLPAAPAPQELGEQKGVVYRQPRPIPVWVLKEDICSADDKDPEHILLEEYAQLPQYGTKRLLPFNNGPFEGSNLDVDFSESGAITKLVFKSDAAGVGASEAFSSLGESYAGYKDAKDGEELAEIERELSVVKKKKELEEAKRALEGYLATQGDTDSQ